MLNLLRLDPNLTTALTETLGLQKGHPRTQENNTQGHLTNLPLQGQIHLTVAR